MVNNVPRPPTPVNEPVLGYLPGSSERIELKEELTRQSNEVIEIPCIINGVEVYTNDIVEQVMPHNHGHVIARVHMAGKNEVEDAIQASLDAHDSWSSMPWEARCAIFLKASELLRGEYRAKINASTMINQSKTCHQAEIDSACELIDFWRFNAYYARQIYEDLQPSVSPSSMWNSSEVRPLEGFVFSVTPFNFSSIAANLPSSAAIMGNTGVWKPSRNSYLSNYYLMRLMMDAGLPDGVINFVPGKASMVGEICLSHPMLAGIHFTGSTAVFRKMWKDVADNLPNMRSYPRIVGETGGMNFHFIFNDANIDNAVFSTIRGAFEYSGQKCSATSRIYIPKSLSKQFIDKLIKQSEQLIVDSPEINNVFTSAVINENAFNKITSVIDKNKDLLIYGGDYSNKVGYFINPSIFLCDNHNSELMNEELFGPTLCLYIYDDNNVEETLYKCSTNRYGLTGSIFTSSEFNVMLADKYLYNSCGNYYINDKSTGSIVFQQPFGGSRKSGTNDKAGSKNFLTRFGNNKIIKLNNCL